VLSALFATAALPQRDVPRSAEHRHVRGVQPSQHLLLKDQAKIPQQCENGRPRSFGIFQRPRPRSRGKQALPAMSGIIPYTAGPRLLNEMASYGPRWRTPHLET
jgi:hypothetical protein